MAVTAPFLLLGGHVLDVPFGGSCEKVNDPPFGDEQINDSRSAALAFSFRAPTDLAQAGQSWDDGPGFGHRRKVDLEPPVFITAKESLRLLGKRGMFDKGEHMRDPYGVRGLVQTSISLFFAELPVLPITDFLK